MISTVEWKNSIVRMLDQTKLPLETVYNDCKDYQTVAKGIKELWVRGAPAIGVSAAMGLALGRDRSGQARSRSSGRGSRKSARSWPPPARPR